MDEVDYLDDSARDREYVFVRRRCVRCDMEFEHRISAAASTRVRLCKSCRHSSDIAVVDRTAAIPRNC